MKSLTQSRTATALLACVLGSMVMMNLSACQTAPNTRGKQLSLKDAVSSTIRKSQDTDTSLTTFFERSYGYVVFPEVGTGAFIVGGAYGRGIVFEGRNPVGYADLSQGSIGFQIGGAAYDELIFFKDKAAFDKFTAGQWTPSASASVTALSAGAAAAANYSDGVAVFVLDHKGLMASAALGAQKFNFVAADADTFN